MIIRREKKILQDHRDFLEFCGRMRLAHKSLEAVHEVTTRMLQEAAADAERDRLSRISNIRLTGDARSANQPGGGESKDEPRK